MAEIIPAIIGKNFTEIREKIARVEALTNWLHLDIADGLFVEDYSWQTAEDLKTLNAKAKLEVHLMMEKPEEFIADWLLVVDRVIVHPESTDQLTEIIEKIKITPVKLGMALLLNSPLELIAPYINSLDIIQLMSIDKLGHHGEPFDERVLERIKTLRIKYPNVKISVDGGINLETGKKCLEAGATKLVVGSALWNSPDFVKTLHDFQSL